MEYLMTYGWMLLVIAIITVAFLQMGALGSSFGATNACVAQPGFICSNLAFSANTANIHQDPSISAIVGSTSITGTSAYFAVVPYGQTISTPSDFNYWGQQYGYWYPDPSPVQSGQEFSAKIYVNLNFPGMSYPVSVGSTLSGEIWMMYSTPTTANLLAEVAIFKAVATSS
jgi:hypothetical protein